MKVLVDNLYYDNDFNDDLEIVDRFTIDDWRHGYVEKLIIKVSDDVFVAMEQQVSTADEETYSILDRVKQGEYVDLPQVEKKEVVKEEWVEV